MAVARDIERQINPLRLRDPWVDFILQPVLRDLALHGLNIPPKLGAKITAFSWTVGSDFESPLDSVARTFVVCSGLAGKGTALTRVAPRASPVPPLPQPVPRMPLMNTA